MILAMITHNSISTILNYDTNALNEFLYFQGLLSNFHLCIDHDRL